MHLNYYYLKDLSQALQEKLTGFTLEACFSQEKDELVLGFTNGSTDFYIKAILTASFAALTFPLEFHRKRQNSVNLFPELLHQRVEKVVQHRGERSFYLQFSGGYQLLFKMFGNRSNLVVFRDGSPVYRFHKKFPDDFNLNPETMDRELALPTSGFPLTLKTLQKQLPTLGELALSWLQEQGFETGSAARQQELLTALFTDLEAGQYRLIRREGNLRLSLLPFGGELERFTDPLKAARQFTARFLSERFFNTHFGALQQSLEKQKHAAEQSLTQVEAKLKALQTEASFSQTADIIMANLTNIPARATEVQLYDFYQDTERLIKLKRDETPQKTAERLYKKAKNQQIEVKVLEEKALRKTEEIIGLEEKLTQLQGISDSRALKQFLKNNETLNPQKATQTESPFREFKTEGFRILVGKSARNNDELTQKHTFKEDLWLHAKDVSGSHVVIKFQAGKTFPVTVIEKAAQLAAYYSKRKTDSICPVIYTPKKYVRKTKGAAPGSVIVEREQVMLVTPGNPFERSFT